MAVIPTDPDAQWNDLRPFAERGDMEGLLAYIDRNPEIPDRISLYRLAIRKLAFAPWENKTLEPMIVVAEAAIAECERIGGDYLEQANIICFNTSANLCDCWDDGLPREERHYRKGIEFAKKAIWYREHLSKGPGKMAMAMWALGKHQQSLGSIEDARKTFHRCLELEEQAAKESAKPTELSPDAPDGYLIARGYVALIDRDTDTLHELLRVLDEMEASGGDLRQDAEIIRPQLLATAKQLDLAL